MNKLFVFAFLLSTAFAAKDPQRIVGGSNAAIADYPFMVALQHSPLGILWSLECAGTLITVNTVLSAAHCFDLRLFSNWRVRLGSPIVTAGSTHNVFKGEIHPQYSDVTLDFDVALLRLQTRVPLSNLVQTAMLAGKNFDLRVGSPVTAIGWGATQASGSGSSFSTILQTVDLSVVSMAECTERYASLAGNTRFVTPRMLCAGVLGQGGKGTCAGDDGGPIIAKGSRVDAVVGITSWQHECASTDYPGVYTNVAELIDWIVDRSLFL